MKVPREHIVPLTDRSMEILIEMQSLSTISYIFPDNLDSQKHINVEASTKAFRQQKIPTSTHGLRTLASTILNETRPTHGIGQDIIEACLAHTDKNIIRSTYNKAQYLDERRRLLNFWSSFVAECDTEKNNSEALARHKILL